ncbi:hypothetical protein LTR66_001637 [Elasticomyces elasticus]|nr:hypothetical protein LTR66_001637 [Elasticomyces elasticus]
MAPIVHCVRHAQGYHNLAAANHSIPDPLLTPFGEQQCRELQENFPFHKTVDCIVASPIKRTIATALLAFQRDIEAKDLKVIALPEIQETSDLPCDTGSDVAEIAREFDGRPVDLTLVKEGWNSKQGKWAPTAKAIDARAREARRWLMQRPEKEIVVVTHGGSLHYLTEDWTGSQRYTEMLPGTGWANTEYRSYTFDPANPANASMVETEESRRRRGPHAEKPLGKEEKSNLENVTHKTWEAQGFQQENSAQEIAAEV